MALNSVALVAETTAPLPLAGIDCAAAPLDDVPSERCRVGFVFFILLNGVLFLRPAETIPALRGWPIYLVVIVLCIAASAPALLARLQFRSLIAAPATICMLGFLVAIFLSNAVHGDLWTARYGAIDFSKTALYFFLLVALIDSPRRVRLFLITLVVFIVGISVLSILQYHGVVNIPGMETLELPDGEDEMGEGMILRRMIGPGIFSDPNDLSLIVVAGIVLCAHWLFDGERSLPARLCWLAPLATLGYTLALTKSRGGFVSLVAAASVFVCLRFNWRKSVPLLVVLLPLIFMLFGGRQTEIDLDDKEDSAMGRIELWRDAFEYFRESPVFGIGYSQYAERNNLVVHNSFMHCFSELGVFGATFFIGMYYLPLQVIRRNKSAKDAEQPSILHSRPCLLATLAGYGAGIFFLSRAYALPTYTIFGVATSYGNVLARQRGGAVPQWSAAVLRHLIVVTMVALIGMYIFLRLSPK